MEHRYRRGGMLNRPVVGQLFFLYLFCRSVGVSDGRAAGNVALRVDEAVMRGIKLHGRGRLVPGRRITTPDGASERHPSRRVLDSRLLLLLESFRGLESGGGEPLLTLAGYGMRPLTFIAPFVFQTSSSN